MGPMVGSDEMQKGITNVRFFDSARETATALRRRLHHRASVRLGRHLAADRLKPLDPKETKMNGRFLINRRDAKVMGVAAGLADYTGVDPTIVRLGFVARR